ncbi:hypothetical protein POTOM_007045 [Populus tomentosa]|uniref:Amino acid transporter transmembrane domain-containing protein n=1 Tax=Populus tomentosa TaxID=118781 RepID=A0A8X8APA0_POPTO|nr:hypothetical protein POTOM_007045 [Populus tomentosa]
MVDSASTHYCLKWNSDSAYLRRNEATGFEYMHRSRLHERWFCLVHLVAPKVFDVNSSSNSDNSNREKKHIKVGKGELNMESNGAIRHSGKTQTCLCGLFQYLFMYGICTAYVITTSTSMSAIRRSNCYHEKGHNAPCEYVDTPYMLIFGAVQIVTSQIPDFHSIEWLSVLAAIMSFAYSLTGFGLGLATVIALQSASIHVCRTLVLEEVPKQWISE